MKKLLFIDRDGTIIKEAPPTYQIDSFDKLEFYPGVFTWLHKIASELDFELVLVSNQDGLGTASYPEESFWPIQNFVMKALENEGILFSDIQIDRTFASDHAATRKPATGMLTRYLHHPDYNIQDSFVIGDRITDVQLAKNLGCQAIWMINDAGPVIEEISTGDCSFQSAVALETNNWKSIYEFLLFDRRLVRYERNTSETKIQVQLNLDGKGNAAIDTGLNFLNHMLEQLSRHSGVDIALKVDGDLHIDEHHTIEDAAIALGEAFAMALGNKKGTERYGFTLPMDDCLAQVALDFGGRNWLVWHARFKRNQIGDMPTEMFYHFFKSFSDAAKCNLNIKAEGENEHHKIESVFKALAKAIKMAVRREPGNQQLPTTKGIV